MDIKRKSRGVRLTTAAVALATVGLVGIPMVGSAATSTTVVNGVKVKFNAAAGKLVPATIKKNGLRIVTSAPYPPFEVFNSQNKLTGLDIDTGRAIAAAMGVKVTFTSIDFNGVIPALQAGKYDMLLADTGDNAARSKVLNFVEYDLQGEVLLVAKGNPDHITGLKSMCGRTLSVENGDVPAGFFNPLTSYCKSIGKPNMTLKNLPNTADALLALTSGNSQAQFVGVATAPSLVTSTKGKVQVVNVPGKVGGYSALYVGAGIPKSEPQLVKAVHAALVGLLANGTLKALFTKYGVQSTLIPAILNNAISAGGNGLSLN